MKKLLAASLLMACPLAVRPGEPGPKPTQPESAVIPVEEFDKLHRLIKPQPGELRFHEIPWLIDVWEARKKAAAEGKPILVWSGAGGAPIGVC
jgi:hypothetical protein